MEDEKKILDAIAQHCNEENRLNCRNPSIGRGEISISGNNPQTLWIVNREYERTSVIQRDITGAARGVEFTGREETLQDKPGEVTISKNREYARKLLSSYQGEQNCVVNGTKVNFTINNSAHYTTSGNSVLNLSLGIDGMADWQSYGSLNEAYNAIVHNEQDLISKRKEEEKARELAEQLRIEQQEEAARKAEEERARLAEEIQKLEQNKQALVNQYNKARAFIQNQVQLKRNPHLDANQDMAKFSNLYNNVVEVINGGPGTGKTTTMIQRLKLLIDPIDLKDFMENHPDELSLSEADFKTIASDNDWIFFSPNEKLKNYLRDNMDYEGLKDTKSKTVVWNDFVKDIASNHYHILGAGASFMGISRKKDKEHLYLKTDLSIVESFIQFYIRKQKEKFEEISKINYKEYDWKIIGKIITKECEKINTVHTVEDLINFLYDLERSYQGVSVKGGGHIDSPAEIADKYNKGVQALTSKYIALLKRENEKYLEVTRFISDPDKYAEDEEGAEEYSEVLADIAAEEDFGNAELRLDKKLRGLLRKLILQLSDRSVMLDKNEQRLYDFMASYINEDELEEFKSSAFFTHRIYSSLRSSTDTLLSPIPAIYKSYRKSISGEEKSNWNEELLDYIVKEKNNKVLHPDEKPLLIGFINNLIKALYRKNPVLFDTLKHEYITAYKNTCRVVIGVDEATDYSLIDYYGIASISHYKVSTITLCGDVMQLMYENGIRDWKVLENDMIFRKIQVMDLKISYRQSLNLMELAGKIYKAETGTESQYQCYLKERETPKPLWFGSDDIDEKAQWISERVMEIIAAYGNMPTIAIFTKDEASGIELRDALEECENLSSAGLDIEYCKQNTFDGERSLRIFSIDQVKGLEFEAVFFHDIDKIESTSLINRYLYVGISRASMYLGVTSNGESKQISGLLQDYFTTNEGW